MEMICTKCGAHFDGRKRDSRCPACRRTAKREPFARICNQCGASYTTYAPRSSYCPACAAERQRIANEECRRRASAGLIRPLGSTDYCQLCGKPYVVASGRQRYCPECAARKRDEGNRARYLQQRRSDGNERRHIGSTDYCQLCGKPYVVTSSRQRYCPECAIELRRGASDRRLGAPRIGERPATNDTLVATPLSLSELLAQYDITQRRFADYFGIAPTLVNKWCSGARPCKPYLISMVAMVFSAFAAEIRGENVKKDDAKYD